MDVLLVAAEHDSAVGKLYGVVELVVDCDALCWLAGALDSAASRGALLALRSRHRGGSGSAGRGTQGAG